MSMLPRFVAMRTTGRPPSFLAMGAGTACLISEYRREVALLECGRPGLQDAPTLICIAAVLATRAKSDPQILKWGVPGLQLWMPGIAAIPGFEEPECSERI